MGRPTTRALARKHSVVLNEARRFDTTGKIKRKEEARNWNGKSVAGKIGALAQGVIGTLTLAYQSAKASAQGLHGVTLHQQACHIDVGQGGAMNPYSIGCGWDNKLAFGGWNQDFEVLEIPGLDVSNSEAVSHVCQDLINHDPCEGYPRTYVPFKPYEVDYYRAARCDSSDGPAWNNSRAISKEQWFADRAKLCNKTWVTQAPTTPSSITSSQTALPPVKSTDYDAIIWGSTMPVVGIAALFSITGVAYMINKVFGRRCCPNKVRSKPRHHPNNTNERLSRRAQYDLELARTHQTTTA